MAEETEKEKEASAGIVLTGTEAFGETQGFIPAAEAEKAGLRVTGVTTEEAADAEETDTPKASKKAGAKASRKK